MTVDKLNPDISRDGSAAPNVSNATLTRYGHFVVYTFLMTLPVLVALVISHVGGPYSWDDGTITLAFGQTLFATGEFALNASSPRVEGSSSLLFTILSGGVIHGLALDFNEAVICSRVISALFLGATSCLLFHILRRSLSGLHAALISALYCLLPVHYAEVFNGMEMTAFAFFLLLYFHFLNQRPLFALAVLPFVILIRIEAGFYLLVVLALATWAALPLDRSRFLQHLCATVLMLLALQLFRTLYFDSFFPNTILAKMHPPYSASGFRGIELKFLGFVDFLKHYAVPIIAIPVLFFLAGPKRRVRPEHLLIIAFGLFAILSGRNWGYDARMTLSLLAPAIVGVAAASYALAEKGKSATLSLLPAALILLTIAGHSVGSIGSVRQLLSALATGASYSEFSELDVSNLDPTQPYSHGFYGVTPDNYRITGEAAEAMAERLDLPVIKFAVPDVGGLGLCCDTVAVIDIALLTNPVLAKRGYAGFDEYLSNVTPDLIQTHGIWSLVTGMYDSQYFQENFTPILFRNNFMYLRNDHAEMLLSRGDATRTSFRAFDFGTVRYGTDVSNGLYAITESSLLQVR
ncbi:MAG: hypothetical protein ACSHWY_05085 [Octadecabacter sp.]